MPVITLLTDFGSQDYFVGAMKGVILSINPNAQIVDITHEIPPQEISAGAFNLLACYKDFPKDTIHVAVVDPGVGSNRKALLVECADQFFVGPDNGLFSWVCEREGKFTARHLTNERFFRQPLSSTFHGRDIFAPVAAALSQGVQPDQFGERLTDIVRLDPLEAQFAGPDTIEGRILHIDRFGNCVTNVMLEKLSERGFSTSWTLSLSGRQISSLREFFAESDNDNIFCIVGSAGFLELSARNASAAEILNAKVGQSVVLKATTLSSISARSE